MIDGETIVAVIDREWLRATMFTGFPWNPAASALVPTPLIRTTPLIGTYGLSGLVVMLKFRAEGSRVPDQLSPSLR